MQRTQMLNATGGRKRYEQLAIQFMITAAEVCNCQQVSGGQTPMERIQAAGKEAKAEDIFHPLGSKVTIYEPRERRQGVESQPQDSN